MATSRLRGRRGDGSAVVLGWVALYTLGLPSAMRARRREDIAAFLVDEALDAVRHGEGRRLRRRRLGRWLVGMPDDLAWRVVDAPAMAADLRLPAPWVPLSRWTSLLLAIVAVGATGAFAIVASDLLRGTAGPAAWPGWGPLGFAVSCLGIMIAVGLAVPWPTRAMAIVVPSVILGMIAAPWLWGCWALSALAMTARWIQTGSATARP